MEEQKHTTPESYVDVKMTPEEYARYLASRRASMTSKSSRGSQRYVGGVVAILGAILVIVGSILPWAEHPFENDSMGGLQTYGKYSLIAAIFIIAGAVIFMIMEKATWGQSLGCIAAVGAFVAALWNFVDKTVFVTYNIFGKPIKSVEANTGFGVYLVFIGAAIAVIGSVAADVRLKSG